MQGKLDTKQGLIPFTIVLTIFSSLYFMYLYQGHQPTPESETFLKELGEGLGSLGLYVMAIIYGRSLLKILLNEGTMLQRFIPVVYQDISITMSRRLLTVLNRYHKHVGATSVGLLLGHALLVGAAKLNPFLVLLLALIAWQGLFGLFLVVRFPIASLKRYGYLVHAQLFSGVMIGVFAIFGHMLT
ncbi:MAG TPA: hypothetical protein HPP94_09300 [Desulfuromonadales bacterium]|nr:hypothetical protein [Desulfuromonadales bacterium]